MKTIKINGRTFELKRKVEINGRFYKLVKFIDEEEFIVFSTYRRHGTTIGSGKTEEEAVKAAIEYKNKMDEKYPKEEEIVLTVNL